jgi:hypothetical protein
MNLDLLYYLREHILEINWSHRFTEDTLFIYGEYNQYEVGSPNTKYIVNLEYNYTTLKTKLIIDKHINFLAVYNISNVCFPKLTNLKELVYKIKKDTIWSINTSKFDVYLTTRSWI